MPFFTDLWALLGQAPRAVPCVSHIVGHSAVVSEWPYSQALQQHQLIECQPGPNYVFTAQSQLNHYITIWACCSTAVHSIPQLIIWPLRPPEHTCGRYVQRLQCTAQTVCASDSQSCQKCRAPRQPTYFDSFEDPTNGLKERLRSRRHSSAGRRQISTI